MAEKIFSVRRVMVSIVRRVKVSYTISGYNKFVLGKVVSEDNEFIIIKSEVKGDTVKIAKRCIDEQIELGGEGQ